MLHPSLTELADAAPLAQDFATVRGVLKESLDLLGNALNHGEEPAELAGWLSQVITDVLHSPGLMPTWCSPAPWGVETHCLPRP